MRPRKSTDFSKGDREDLYIGLQNISAYLADVGRPERGVVERSEVVAIHGIKQIISELQDSLHREIFSQDSATEGLESAIRDLS